MEIKDVIKILSSSSIKLISNFADEEYCGEALSTAISELQKYEEMKKKVSVEKIEKVYYDNQGNCALTQHQKLICQSIFNYLGDQPDEL